MPHAAAARDMFNRLAGHGVPRVVVDMAEVPFVDSRGLMALLHGFRLFGSDRRRFRLVGLQDQPRLLLQITGADQLLLAGTAQP
jgi:anti-anti-sigma factor